MAKEISGQEEGSVMLYRHPDAPELLCGNGVTSWLASSVYRTSISL